MVVMVMMVNNHHHLRLRRVGYREARNKSEREQNLFHSLSIGALVIRWLSYSDLCGGVIAAQSASHLRPAPP